MKQYNLHTDCISGDCDDLTKMIDNAIDVTYEEVLDNCNGVLEWADRLGYDRNAKDGLTLKDDWHVGYSKSDYQWSSCYFITWSAIETVWIKE